MIRICPNCPYVGKPADTPPDWQFPACKLAYTIDGDLADWRINS